MQDQDEFNDDYETDWEEDCKREKEYWEQVKLDQEAWKAKWPNHCQNCGGWGGFITKGKYSGPYDQCYEDTFDECEILAVDQCHRCKGQLIQEGEENPHCKKCGWSWDDGIPQF